MEGMGNAGDGAVEIYCINITFLPFASHINPCQPQCDNQTRHISHKIQNYSIYYIFGSVLEQSCFKMTDATKEQQI